MVRGASYFPINSTMKVYVVRRKRNESDGAADNKRNDCDGERRWRSDEFVTLTLTPSHVFTPHLIGSQWRQDLRKWFSSPDPSTNHIILCGAQHQGTANWFFRGRIFEEWRSTGSLLWIHGKRASFNPHTQLHSLI